jgi:mannose-6-phosphate isomerase-like protein (cupin superfamily)
MNEVRAIAVDAAARGRPEYWSQEIIGQANGSLFKVAKGIGSTRWHSHEDQDEAFFVTHGTLVIELPSGDVVAHAGDFVVVPRGVEHRPRADAEVRFLIVGTSVTSTAAGGKPAWSIGGGGPARGRGEAS